VSPDAVDETASQIGREQYWLYAALDLESKLLFSVRGSRCTRLGSTVSLN